MNNKMGDMISGLGLLGDLGTQGFQILLQLLRLVQHSHCVITPVYCGHNVKIEILDLLPHEG
jgi:hypothetical protein